MHAIQVFVKNLYLPLPPVRDRLRLVNFWGVVKHCGHFVLPSIRDAERTGGTE